MLPSCDHAKAVTVLVWFERVIEDMDGMVGVGVVCKSAMCAKAVFNISHVVPPIKSFHKIACFINITSVTL